MHFHFSRINTEEDLPGNSWDPKIHVSLSFSKTARLSSKMVLRLRVPAGSGGGLRFRFLPILANTWEPHLLHCLSSDPRWGAPHGRNLPQTMTDEHVFTCLFAIHWTSWLKSLFNTFAQFFFFSEYSSICIVTFSFLATQRIWPHHPSFTDNKLKNNHSSSLP